nr:hypothetical protein [Micromonospora sp. DSM 115978]
MIHSFHLALLPPSVTLRALLRRPRAAGLRHAECLALMRLGSPAVSWERMQLRRLAMFAEWEDEPALERFLADEELGRRLNGGWHVRLRYLRRYGEVSALAGLPVRAGGWDPQEPIVAVTLARLKLPELPRFLRWGRPVEHLVVGHPGTTFATAAIRPPHTFSTFTVWRSVREMTDMVHGRGAVPQDRAHAVAMAEQHRRDFHHESAFMRFRPLSEHGTWEGRRLLP